MAGRYLTPRMKTLLFTVLAFQLIATVERQVFDFLGYMWAPIIGNFFHIIAVILCSFGACHYYCSCLVVYTVWSLLWLGWNLFVICLYLEVGILNRTGSRYILTLGADSQSWWLKHGIGCSSAPHNDTGPEELRVDPEGAMDRTASEQQVQGCLLPYHYVEVIHASVQVLLTLAGLAAALAVIQAWLERGTTCRYLARTSTYSPPPLLHPLLTSSSSSSTGPPTRLSSAAGPPGVATLADRRGRAGYVPVTPTSTSSVSLRDSWCLPTYVSFQHQSMDELSGSFTCAGSTSRPSCSNPNSAPPYTPRTADNEVFCLSPPSSSASGGGGGGGVGVGGRRENEGDECGSSSGEAGNADNDINSSAEGLLELECRGNESLRSSTSSAAATVTTITTTTSTTAASPTGPCQCLNITADSSTSSLDQ